MQKNATPQIFSPFWVCLAVFAVLAVDSGLRFSTLWQQHRELAGSQLAKPENVTKLGQLITQRREWEPRLQALSLDLLQIAQTNMAARQIVQEFNISWTPPAGSK